MHSPVLIDEVPPTLMSRFLIPREEEKDPKRCQGKLLVGLRLSNRIINEENDKNCLFNDSYFKLPVDKTLPPKTFMECRSDSCKGSFKLPKDPLFQEGPRHNLHSLNQDEELENKSPHALKNQDLEEDYDCFKLLSNLLEDTDVDFPHGMVENDEEESCDFVKLPSNLLEDSECDSLPVESEKKGDYDRVKLAPNLVIENITGKGVILPQAIESPKEEDCNFLMLPSNLLEDKQDNTHPEMIESRKNGDSDSVQHRSNLFEIKDIEGDFPPPELIQSQVDEACDCFRLPSNLLEDTENSPPEMIISPGNSGGSSNDMKVLPSEVGGRRVSYPVTPGRQLDLFASFATSPAYCNGYAMSMWASSPYTAKTAHAIAAVADSSNCWSDAGGGGPPLTPCLKARVPAAEFKSRPPSYRRFHNYYDGIPELIVCVNEDEISLLADDPEEDDANSLPHATYDVLANIFNEMDKEETLVREEDYNDDNK